MLRSRITCLVTLLVLIKVCYGCNILVLTGGGSYGACQAGAIAKLIKNGNKWDVITGVSSGSINGYFLSGLVNSNNITDIFNFTWSHMKSKDVYVFDPFELEHGLLDNSPLRKTIYEYAEKYGILKPLVPDPKNLCKSMHKSLMI